MGTKHTPTPWNAKNGYVFTGELDSHGLAQSGCYVANCCVGSIGGLDGPNAEHIARAVNAHDDLLAACKLAAEAFVNHLDYDCDESSAEREAYRALQAAIAKAEGQQ